MTRTSVRRPVLLGAAWTASAAAAIGLGFLAVSLVDASASPGTSPVGATTSSSAGAAPTGSAPDGSATDPLPPVASATGEFATDGGTVFADCTSGSPVLAGVPAAGWWVDHSDDLGKIEFENDDDDIDVHVACIDGAPQFAYDDDAFRSSSSSSSTSSSPSPSSSSTGSPSSSSGRDDSDGRSGGGHGSDDGPGDDSSGRDGGGHGSDD